MATTTDLMTLKINYLTQAQYDTAKNNGQINENEIYLTPNSGTATYTAGTGINIDSSNNVSVKLGYTTAGLNRAVSADGNGNLYVTQMDDDTKNTAGSTDTSSKIFLIGATSQAANPQTYSHDTAYVGTDGCLYSGGAKVLTAHQTAVTSITTTAGTHSVKSSATGAVSFNVPTKTSHLTNDSGFLTLATLPIYSGTVE